MTIRVSIVSPFFPHYRDELFSHLDKVGRHSYTFVGDTRRFSDNGVPGFDSNRVSRFVRTSAHPLPAGAVWQEGVVRHALVSCDDAFVFTGDPRHIATWVAALILRARKKRVLFWTHGWSRRDRWHVRFVRNSFYKLASGLLLYGSHAEAIGRTFGFDPTNLHVIRNSMGARTSLPVLDDAPGRRSRTQRWIVITRLIPSRRIDVVIRGVAELQAEGKRVDLTIVGDGECRESLEALSRDFDVRATFLGAIYDPKVTEHLLSESDIYLSPGHVGLGAIHALSAGVPVSTHDNPERQMPEAESVRDGITGVRFPVDDLHAMIHRTWSFVAGTDRMEVAQACHQEVLARWSTNRHADAIEEALD